ncbi:MAG: ATP-binding protein [Maricaulaceae bacterium]
MIIIYLLSFCLTPFHAFAQDHSLSSTSQTSKIDVTALQIMYKDYYNTPNELISKIDSIIDGLDESEPIITRIRLDNWRLIALTDIIDTRVSSDFAKKIYAKYDRDDYANDELYAKIMNDLIQALTKTLDLDICFEIIKNLRTAAYENPSVALDLMIDMSLMEIYIETFDYQHALDIELSILRNPEYETLQSFRDWKPSLYNEIAFLYNKIGNGVKAREYLDRAKTAYQTRDMLPHKRLKAEANNNGNRGRSYLLDGRYAEAEKMGKITLDAGNKLNQKYVITLGYRLIGSAALHTGQYTKAKDMLEKGINIADEYHIATMKRSLYHDYVSTLEKLDMKAMAFTWQKKLFTLEMDAQKIVTNSREALFLAESRAESDHHELLDLKQKNESQRLLSIREKSINRLLTAVIVLLILVASVFGLLFYWNNKHQKVLILSEKKARKASQDAQEANRAKSEFLANMSHEIRTPMNGVLGMTQVLQTTELTEKQAYYTNVILESGNNLMNIIGDILDLSKIESGKLIINPQPCNLETVIHNIIDLFSASANLKNLDLTLEYDPKIPQNLYADKHRIRQIISNLVGNAIKFTNKGSITLRVSGHVENTIATIDISVKDTGIGIQPDKMETVFEKFMQAEGSTTRLYGGSGLGLTISRDLVRAMKGQLNVESEFGQSTTFTLSLPMKLVAPSQFDNVPKDEKYNKLLTHIASPLQANPHSVPEDLMESQNLSFLIIGEDGPKAQTIARHLTHPRAHITIASDSLEAVNSLKTCHFDMIFLNIGNSILESVLTIKKIRDFEQSNLQANTPLICLFKDATLDDTEICLKNGANECLMLPLQKGAFLNAVKPHLSSTASLNKNVQDTQTLAS